MLNMYILLLLMVTGAGPQEGEEAVEAGIGPYEAAFSCEIEAALDQADWKIEGSEKITLYNRTEDVIEEFAILLPANAYANPDIHSPVGLSDRSQYGYIEVAEVTMEGGAALQEPPEILGTKMIVKPPSPVEPDEALTLNMAFTTKLPRRNSGRFGYTGRHVDAFGWYPKPPDGFGDFIVTLSLPTAYRVEATGDLKESYEKNEILTVIYEAKRVNDFAWAADPLFGEEKSLYKGVNIVVLGQPFIEDKVPSLMNTAKDCLDRFDSALTKYPYNRFVLYTAPYGAGAVADAPMFLSLSQGFPTHLSFLRERTLQPESDVIESMARMYFSGPVLQKGEEGAWLSDGIAAFVGLEGTEEFFGAEPAKCSLSGLEHEILLQLLNRGFGFSPSGNGGIRSLARFVNTNSLVGYHLSPFHSSRESSFLGYGIEEWNRPGWNLRKRALFKRECAHAARIYPAARPEGRCLQGSYRGLIRNRVALCLKTLENVAGEDKMKRILKEYAERCSFMHPGVDDFLAIVQEAAGPAHASLLEELLTSSGFIDYAVESALCVSAAPSRGYKTQEKAGEPVSEIAPAEKNLSCRSRLGSLIRFGKKEEADISESDSRESSNFQWEVIVSNRGDIALPVTVLLSFEGGQEKTVEWDGKSGFMRLSGEGREKLLSASVDPERKYALDLNRVNNARCVDYNVSGVFYLAGLTQYWTQNYLNGWALFN